jgi:hypothetical protein
LTGELSADDWGLINRITIKKISRIAENGKAKLCKKFRRLHKTQHPPLPLTRRRLSSM